MVWRSISVGLCQSAFKEAFLRDLERRVWRATGFNAARPERGPDRGVASRSPCCGPIARYLLQTRARPSSQQYYGSRRRLTVRNPRLMRQAPGRALRTPLRSRCGGGARGASTGGARGADHAALDQVLTSLDEDRIIRRFLGLIEATLRTKLPLPARPERRAQGVPISRFKIWTRRKDIPSCRLPRPLLRGLRLLSAHGGVHLRFGMVARGGYPLVRPARGLPHRDPGPGQGADGEECGHRAGRLQGRLRGQATAADRRPRGAFQAGGSSSATRSSCAACSTSPTTCGDGESWCRRHRHAARRR